MRISDLEQGCVSTLDIQQVDEASFPKEWAPRSEVTLSHSMTAGWFLKLGDNVCAVRGASGTYEDILRGLATRALPRLTWIVQRIPPTGISTGLSIQVHEFGGIHHWSEPMEIGLDNTVVEDMRRRRRSLVSVQSLVDWLTEQLFLPPQEFGGPARALLSGSPMPSPGQKTAFRLYGKDCAVDIAIGADERLRVRRVVNTGRVVDDERRPIHLASGVIRFCDATVAGKFRETALTEIDALVKQADSYLGLWQKYNDRELAAIRRRAQEFGWIRYRRAVRLAEGDWRFDLDVPPGEVQNLRRELEALEDDLLEADVEIPPAIQEDGELIETPRRGRKPFVGSIKGRWTASRLELRVPPQQEDRRPPEEGGYLFVSLMGDEVRLQRRQRAWQAIRSLANPMPQLGLMIEKQPVQAHPVRHRNPITPEVRKVFPKPNDRQRRALDIALNTPDIALIQGPPGTGKTRVIAALQARLADSDEGFGRDGLAGNTLLTSFQHDAVEHAASATQVMGLPAIKIGYRRGAQDVVDDASRWAKNTADRVRAARTASLGEHSIHAALRKIRQQVIAHIEAPGPKEASLALLEYVYEMARPWLPASLKQECEDLAGCLREPARPRDLAETDRAAALDVVRALRIKAPPFADDGPMIAHRVLRRLARLDAFTLRDEEQSILQQAANAEPDQPPDETLLNNMRQVRDSLIDRLQPIRQDAGRLIHADVQDLCIQALSVLNERAKYLAPGIDIALDEWLNALDNDPNGIREMLQHYSMVLAATCQQAVSKPMADAKSGENTIFRNVIVDEAARANPLDLLIPMALAERRIILVGDHRQLPHILEPDIERELEQSIQEETRAALRDSLFERLFLELREREKNDGIPRTVTLNVQYRMHPVLGDFISQQFYEPHGESLVPGRDAAEFVHAVSLADHTSLAGKVGAWIHLPNTRGMETAGRSKRRAVEAERVVQEVKNLRSRYPELSVGVISFYAAQCDEILAGMVSAGLTEPDDEGGYRIRDSLTPDGSEALRVGTVDAFQGKEFDIVLLSLTRSNTVAVKDEHTRRKRYGFLVLANRLCVAMSRQRRLLVAIGDMDMASGPEAEGSVPALVAFKQLCEGPHGCVIWA